VEDHSEILDSVLITVKAKGEELARNLINNRDFVLTINNRDFLFFGVDGI